MSTRERGNGVLGFSLLGISVEIRPSMWILLAILGGGLRVNDGASLSSALIFVVAGALCLLAHEMGHALTGKHFTKFSPWVTLGGLGGMTYFPVPPQTKAQHFLTVLAGPMASFAFGLAIALLMGMQCGNLMAGISFYLLAPLGLSESIPPGQAQAIISAFYIPEADGGSMSFPFEVYSTTLLISMWWSIFNLLPILPMDGGHLLRTLSGNTKLTACIGVILSVLLLVAGLCFKMFFTVMLMAYFAFINFQIMRQNDGSSRED